MTIKKSKTTNAPTTTTAAIATAAAMTSSNITPPLSVAAVAVQESDRQRIENATQGLSTRCFNYLSNRVLLSSSVGKQNALTISDYISSLRSEINPSNHYRNDTIIL
ncbi:MAG: hypothetical protein ACJ719_10115, partial [Nitrososphaeraceae archaeon]